MYAESYCFFFFKQKTAYDLRISDWSSDVCSSDLYVRFALPDAEAASQRALIESGRAVLPQDGRLTVEIRLGDGSVHARSEERSVGKECVSTGRSRGGPEH